MVSRTRRQKFYRASGLVFGGMMILGIQPALANVEQIKIYKEAFPGSKPRCLFCHVDKIPKKDAGLHELNAYGTKVKSTAPEITEESFKAVGAFEDFKEEGAQADDTEAQAKPACDPADEGCGKAAEGQK